MNEKFISVHKELPKKDGNSSIRCLVNDTCWGIVVRPFNECYNCWDDESADNYYTKAVGGRITHWQHLPQSPTEELYSISNESMSDVEFASRISLSSIQEMEEELSLNEIENIVSKGLDENYYPNLPKLKQATESLLKIEGKDLVSMMENNMPLCATDTDVKIYAEECAQIAILYAGQKISEINNLIDEHINYYKGKIVNNDRMFWDAQIACLLVLQSKIKSLK